MKIDPMLVTMKCEEVFQSACDALPLISVGLVVSFVAKWFVGEALGLEKWGTVSGVAGYLVTVSVLLIRGWIGGRRA